MKRLCTMLLGMGLAVSCIVGSAMAANYTVVKGDTLWSIAGRNLGAGSRWTEIYKANQNSIKNPHWISIGQVLTIPTEEKQESTEKKENDLIAWEHTTLSFMSAVGTVDNGVLSWNPDTMEWKARFPTSYGETKLSGTYTKDGSMTLIEDSTGGHAKADIPAIQEVFREALAWKRVPLDYKSGAGKISDGVLEWNETAMEWRCSFMTVYCETRLSGTYAKDGSMTLVEDSTGDHYSSDIPAIEEVFKKALSGWRSAPLSFQSSVGTVNGGTISWNKNTLAWSCSFPTSYGDTQLSGTFTKDGALTLVEDSTGGHASADIPAIQEVFIDALNGRFVSVDDTGDETEPGDYSEKQTQLLETIENDDGNMWHSAIAEIVKNYDPEARSGETIFYGASNFAQWYTMEKDLAPYSVQNHAFGGSCDKDLVYWAESMLYTYNPSYVFFQTGSNDYIASTAETDALKVEEAMTYKKEMFAAFHEKLPEAKFIVMSGILLPGRSEYVDMTLEINDQRKAFCEETDYMIYIDAESLTYDREAGEFVENVETLFRADQIHLTEEARITWAEKWILPMLSQLGAVQK